MSKLRIKIMSIIIISVCVILGIKLYELRQSIKTLDIASENLLLETEALDKYLKSMIKEYEAKHEKDTKDTDDE